MTPQLLRWILILTIVIVPCSSARAQRLTPERFPVATLHRTDLAVPAQGNPLERLMHWPVDCSHGQGMAFVSGALAGAVTGWFAYYFVAMGVFAPNGPSKRDAVRTSMAIGAGVVGLFSMYQWHRQCA